jgi:hypothetical protein
MDVNLPEKDGNDILLKNEKIKGPRVCIGVQTILPPILPVFTNRSLFLLLSG